MQTTTQAYKDSVYATSRAVDGRVTFEITDTAAVGDVSSVVTTTGTTYSAPAQVTNGVRDATYKIATLEQDRFKLDGSFSFTDEVTPANNGEVGFVSDGLCAADGTFSTFPTATITLNSAHTSAGVTITFDRLSGEYAIDFNVSAYNASDVLIISQEVTGNTLVAVSPIAQLNSYKKIVVTIKKWSVGNRRARLVELDFGTVKVYTGDELISMRLIEACDPISGQIPSTEFDFTVDNRDRAFNILNPSGFYAYLKQRQRVKAELGVDIGGGVFEYKTIGDFLLSEWRSEEGSRTATFISRTNLDIMSGFTYENATPTATTLYQLAVDMFVICGITNYSIDTALQSISTNKLLKKTDCRTILQMIALAGECIIYVTHGNVITVKRSPALSSPVDTVTLDSMYDEAKIELEGIVKQVEVSYWTSLTTSVAVTSTNAGITTGDTLKLSENTLIDTSTRATAVGTWMINQKANRAKYTLNWRGNPAQEVADIIAVGNSYGADKNTMITFTELNYQGFLRARTEVKGVVS